ncbi:MAG: hypothetical protein A2148_07755 [Chloroflexi bacterium RBG_16_68_14]|nr:MAG: hypothetical protein A2148_07755 [Chloroflexi bacterium RBG_16_68_14]
MVIGGWLLLLLLAAFGVTYGYFFGMPGLIGGLPAVALFGVLTFAAARRRGPEWALLPIAWAVLVPALTVPLQIAYLDRVADGTCTEVPSANIDIVWTCSTVDVLPTLLPGLLNVVPLLWLVSSRGDVRCAALAAAVFGAVRLLVPALFWLAEGDDVTLIGSYQFPPATPYNASLVVGPFLWFLTLASGAALEWRVLGPGWIAVLALGAAGASLAAFFIGLGFLALDV